ncbi:MAG: hypothetical protein U1E02_14125 [Hydrogenophaga sp.]|nr:hypothetical protein [Hydrogenophaga sp.]
MDAGQHTKRPLLFWSTTLRPALTCAPRPHRETRFGTMAAIHPTSTFRRGVPAGSTFSAEEIEMPTGSRAAPTATLLAKSKKTAKALARSTELTHAQALERVASDAGYSSWRELMRACESTGRTESVKDDIPVDPELPPDFDNTPNEERSTEDLDTWWDRPFAQTRSDGTFDVRCLEGGAWDRATFYGTADTLEAARLLAKRKLANWQKCRSAPTVFLSGSEIKLIRMPQRPDKDVEVLYVAKDQQDATRWLEEHGNSDNFKE